MFRRSNVAAWTVLLQYYVQSYFSFFTVEKCLNNWNFKTVKLEKLKIKTCSSTVPVRMLFPVARLINFIY